MASSSIGGDSAIISPRFGLHLYHLKYFTFLICGLASLWPWNCFLSATNYFAAQLAPYPYLSTNFASIMMTLSTLISAIGNYILSQRQIGVNYTQRVQLGNYIQIGTFICLVLVSCLPLLGLHGGDTKEGVVGVWGLGSTSTMIYFLFIMASIAITSVGSCLTQVGLMALVNTSENGFKSWYGNGVVIGNAIAGVMPPISMVLAVLGNQTADDGNNSRSGEALRYFIISVVVICIAQGSLMTMQRFDTGYNLVFAAEQQQGCNDGASSHSSETDDQIGEEQFDNVSFKQLWSKLKYQELTIALTFAITLIFPVFASNVSSIHGIDSKVFTPIAFLVWNLGDLLGRIIVPLIPLKSNLALISYSLGRLCFVPLFLLCHLQSKKWYFFNDEWYMLWQLLFGVTNGHAFACGYVRIGEVLQRKDEQQAASAFTALVINLSLLWGSLLSFIVGYISNV